MSFAIFVSETATVFNAPEVSTIPSRAAVASNGSAGAEISSPVSSERIARTRSANSMRVEAGADRGASEGNLAEPRQGVLYPLDTLPDLRRIAAELLPEGHGHGVHPVRAAGLDDVGELLRLRLE
jgi:hypothetical protein